jgi:Tat protein translocase TatB subunit
MFGIGMQELLVLLVIALVVIGPKKLPEMAKALGKGYGEFRRAFEDMRSSINVDMKTDEEKERLREIRERVQPPPETPPSTGTAPEGDVPSPAPPSGGETEPAPQTAGEPDPSASDPPAAPVDTAALQYSDEEIEGGGD